MTVEIETGIYQRLTNDSSVSALVSTRVYPVLLPQGCDVPAIRYTNISRPPVNHKKGASGLTQSRIQVDCYDKTYEGAKTLGKAVRLAMIKEGGTWGGCPVSVCRNVDHTDETEEIDVQGNIKIYFNASMDFLIWHGEDIT